MNSLATIAAFPSSFVIAAYIQVRLTPQDFRRPRKRDFEDSTCICLPARSPALRDEGRGIFDQPENNEFFNRLFIIDNLDIGKLGDILCCSKIYGRIKV